MADHLSRLKRGDAVTLLSHDREGVVFTSSTSPGKNY